MSTQTKRPYGQCSAECQRRGQALGSHYGHQPDCPALYLLQPQRTDAKQKAEQLGEDLEWMSAAVENRLFQHWMAHQDYDRSASEPRNRARAAFERITKRASAHDEAMRLVGLLADALLEKGDTYEDGWHMYGCPASDVSEGACSERCHRDRAALKAAGRL